MSGRILTAILRGGYCTRWHANPDLAHIRETLAEHHARVAQIILALHPSPALELIDAALHHDAGEPEVGDLPWPFKRRYPDIRAAHAAAEDRALADIGVRIDLPENDRQWLKFADRLAAYAHMCHVAPHLMRQVEWRAARQDLLRISAQLIGEMGILRVLREVERCEF